MNFIYAVLALLVLGGFLAILAIEVPSPDLVAVVILTFVLALVDFIRSLAASRDK